MQFQRVLFVDDNVLCNLEMCDALRGHGYRVVSTFCATAAFEVLDRHQYLSALITDIDLGPGPDGFDLARHARAAYPHLPVVYISGSAAKRHAAEGVEGSIFISKPLGSRDMIAAVESSITHAET
ncbi:MAG: response regulator [Phenylobacterium sp.]|uniref:response regulator n=1 Tax=Phenylobacterium sp. TaxID=1871053 RepID=UPI0027337798|nr:response regulator [Phenylobacterium sp.]MDP3174967.1 response regulator [Phenylobacterium sp.]